jgi:hypothetical protein
MSASVQFAAAQTMEGVIDYTELRSNAEIISQEVFFERIRT